MSDGHLASSPSAADIKAAIRLLRQLLRGPCRATYAGDHVLVCGKEFDARHRHRLEVVRRAVSQGLVRSDGGLLSASDEAAVFLKRALVSDPEGEPFQAQHREMEDAIVVEDRKPRAVRRNMAESPLSALSRLKDRNGQAFLPENALDAGERLAADFERGQLQPRITSSWEPRLAVRTKGEAGGQADLGDAALSARLRVNRAVDAMGPELAGVAMDICCFGKGLELVERERGWPVRSAKLMLRTALLALARHYAPPSKPGRASHHWGTADFRPQM
jgi:hypothetical protein